MAAYGSYCVPWASTDGGDEVGPRHSRTATRKDFHLDITQLNLRNTGVTLVYDIDWYERRREVSRDSIYAYSIISLAYVRDREKSV